MFHLHSSLKELFNMKKNIAIFVLLALILILVFPVKAAEAADGKQTNTSGAQPTDTQIRRAIACSAVYTVASGIPWDLFMMDLNLFSDAQQFINAKKLALSTCWGINNREDALNTIQWLKEEGHRTFFDDVASIVSQATDAQYKILLDGYTGDEYFLDYIEFAREHRNDIGEESLLAWDYCRLIGILEDCYYLGYITREEAIKEIISAAQVLQENFPSWEAMAQNHLLGRKFWDKNAFGTEELNQTVDWLLTDKSSPWLIYQWDYPLK